MTSTHIVFLFYTRTYNHIFGLTPCHSRQYFVTSLALTWLFFVHHRYCLDSFSNMAPKIFFSGSKYFIMVLCPLNWLEKWRNQRSSLKKFWNRNRAIKIQHMLLNISLANILSKTFVRRTVIEYMWLEKCCQNKFSENKCCVNKHYVHKWC